MVEFASKDPAELLVVRRLCKLWKGAGMAMTLQAVRSAQGAFLRWSRAEVRRVVCLGKCEGGVVVAVEDPN